MERRNGIHKILEKKNQIVYTKNKTLKERGIKTHLAIKAWEMEVFLEIRGERLNRKSRL